jgi:hypothetical protein
MTAVRMLPKCADGYCGWRDCWKDATSATFRRRVSSDLRAAGDGVADVRFCALHKRFAVPGMAGMMPTRRVAIWAKAEAAVA